MRQPDRRRARPFGRKKVFCREDRGRDAGQHRKAVFRIANRRRKHVVEAQRAVVSQQQHPGVECAGHHRRQHPGAGHLLQSQARETLERRGRRIGPLPADHHRRGRVMGLHDDRHLAARPDQMRLDDLQHEPRRGRRIERVAAALQDRHRDRARDPVRGRDRSEGAADFRTGGEVLHTRSNPHSSRIDQSGIFRPRIRKAI